VRRLLEKYLKRILKGALANVNTPSVVTSTIGVSDRKQKSFNQHLCKGSM